MSEGEMMDTVRRMVCQTSLPLYRQLRAIDDIERQIDCDICEGNPPNQTRLLALIDAGLQWEVRYGHRY